MAHILVSGLGRLGTALALRWQAAGHRVSGIRRSDTAPAGIDLYSQNLVEDPVLLPPDQVDLVYLVLSPAQYSVEAYRDAFLTAPLRLLDALAERQPLPPVVFVSSTSVYGRHPGRMDENTPPRPEQFNGRILLAAEEEVSTRSMATTVRFSGIYGPGSKRLLDQARAIAEGAEAPAPTWTNRIHQDDCVALLEHVGQRWLLGELCPPIVLGTDRLPSLNVTVLNWLGEQMGLSLDLAEPDIAPGKRLFSRYLEQESKLELRYPDFRSGYAAILAGL